MNTIAMKNQKINVYFSISGIIAPILIVILDQLIEDRFN